MMQSFVGHGGDVMSLDLSPSESGTIFASAVSKIKLTGETATWTACLIAIHIYGFTSKPCNSVLLNVQQRQKTDR